MNNGSTRPRHPRRKAAHAPERTPRPDKGRREVSRRRTFRRNRRGLPPYLLTLVAGFAVTVVTCAGLLWWWGRATPAPTAGYRRVELDSEETSSVFERLAAANLLESPGLMRWYQRIWHPFFRAETGSHWLGEALAPEELLGSVGRSRSRRVTRVTLPEGWDSFQMAERFAGAGICARDDFLAAVFSSANFDDDNVSPFASLEGRLYPASYDFRVNTRAVDVVAKLVSEADKRHRATFASHAPRLTQLGQSARLSEQDILVLASVVEKEAANEAELPLVASVFLNRLRNPDFRPSRMLQSDPTAAYGCKRDPALNSCGHFTGKVTPAMLRDAANPFNTYRHAGLPPTPIGNPSTRAIEAVLTAPSTDYFFFVSPDGGPHRFSRTLQEHEGHLR